LSWKASRKKKQREVDNHRRTKSKVDKEKKPKPQASPKVVEEKRQVGRIEKKKTLQAVDIPQKKVARKEEKPRREEKPVKKLLRKGKDHVACARYGQFRTIANLLFFAGTKLNTFSFTSCHKGKARCEGGMPCNRCARLGRPCLPQAGKKPSSKRSTQDAPKPKPKSVAPRSPKAPSSKTTELYDSSDSSSSSSEDESAQPLRRRQAKAETKADKKEHQLAPSSPRSKEAPKQIKRKKLIPRKSATSSSSDSAKSKRSSQNIIMKLLSEAATIKGSIVLIFNVGVRTHANLVCLFCKR